MANVLQQVLQRQAMQDHLDEKLKQVKPALSHVGMYIGLIAYTAIGALVSHFKAKKGIHKLVSELSGPNFEGPWGLFYLVSY